MWFKRDHRNTSLDDFLFADKKKFKKFITFAANVANNLGKKTEPSALDSELRARNENQKYVAGNFEFIYYITSATVEIIHHRKVVLMKCTNSKKYMCYEPGNWENELENLMATPDLHKYAS